MKTTLSTIKSFIRKSGASLHIKYKSDFDGMTDCVRPCDDNNFKPVQPGKHSNNIGVAGAWFVGSSRDYFTPYADDNFAGFRVSNCCGSFILAIRK